MTTSTDRRTALAEQLFGSMLGALEIFHVYVGDRLGLYTTLDGRGPLSVAEFAAAAGIHERYAREWLEQQAVAGVLDVSGDDERRFELSADAAAVLVDPDSDYHLGAGGQMIAGIAAALPQVLTAFRTGGEVPYRAYGADMRMGIARMNRPMFVNHLVQEWIPALPDIDERLRNGGRAADLGCGRGFSTRTLARGYPNAKVDGLDLDEASIAEAQASVEPELEGRVSFVCRNADDPALSGQYDLVTLFETLHDMAHPVEALRAARGMLTEGGAVLVGDEKVAETFAAPGDELERFNYGWSALHCLAAAMGEEGTAATGTVIRPDTVRKYAHEAGFSTVEVLPIEHDFWRFYRLNP